MIYALVHFCIIFSVRTGAIGMFTKTTNRAICTFSECCKYEPTYYRSEDILDVVDIKEKSMRLMLRGLFRGM